MPLGHPLEWHWCGDAWYLLWQKEPSEPLFFVEPFHLIAFPRISLAKQPWLLRPKPELRQPSSPESTSILQNSISGSALVHILLSTEPEHSLQQRYRLMRDVTPTLKSARSQILSTASQPRLFLIPHSSSTTSISQSLKNSTPSLTTVSFPLPPLPITPNIYNHPDFTVNTQPMNTPQDLQQAQKSAAKHTGFVLTFFNSTDTDSAEMLNEFLPEVIDQYPALSFVKIDVNDSKTAPLVSTFNIATTPTFVTVLDKATIGHVQGFEAPEIITLIEQLSTKATLYQRLYSLITQSPFVLFMKGTKDTPRCGFSRKMCELLAKHDIEFTTFNILEDEEVRQELKTYSNWPTFPQFYFKGELLGGLDVVTEMAEAGELKDLQ